MNSPLSRWFVPALLLLALNACTGTPTAANPPAPATEPALPPTVTPPAEPVQLSIILGETNDEQGISFPEHGFVRSETLNRASIQGGVGHTRHGPRR